MADVRSLHMIVNMNRRTSQSQQPDVVQPDVVAEVLIKGQSDAAADRRHSPSIHQDKLRASSPH